MPVGWAADVAQTDLGFAPFVLFPLLIGVGLGAILVGAMRLGQVGHRPTIVLGVVLAAGLAVLGQHYLGYRSELVRVERQRQTFRQARLQYPELLRGYEPKPPASLLAYLQSQARRGRDLKIGGYVACGWAAWTWWGIDALLVVAAALGIVVPAMRQPYCSRCQSWYRVVRSGRIRADTARKLAEAAEVAVDEHPTSARYRLLSCQGGCGPTAFSLTWQQADGSTRPVQAWIDAERCRRMGRVLEETDRHRAR